MKKRAKTVGEYGMVGLLLMTCGASACGSKTHSLDAGSAGSGGSGGRDAGHADAGKVDAGQSLKWFLTCGYPVCGAPGLADGGTGAPLCTSEKAGQSCGHKGATCDPSAGCGENLLCTDHDPRMQVGGCPISRAAFKRDIEYLDRSELRRYADELLAMPLVTFRYKDDPRARKRLGFVIEDVEPSAPESVDVARDRVDLYGYTTMAAAALKLQDEELKRLRVELRAVTHKLQALEAERNAAGRGADACISARPANASGATDELR